MIEKNKFSYSTFGKAFEKEPEKQVGAIKSPDTSNKSKRMDCIFSQNLMINLVCAKLKEIVELQDII